MPLITKTESFSLNGMLFKTEVEAVEQGLLNLGAKIVKEFASCGGQGLVANREELLELLIAHKRLDPSEATSVAHVQAGSRPATRPDFTTTTDRDPATGLLPGEMIGSL